MGEWLKWQRFSPRSEELEPHIRHLEGKKKESHAFKASGFPFRRPRGWWEIETLLIKGTHKTSYILGPRAEAVIERSLGQTYLLILKSLLEGQEAAGAHSGDIDTSGSHLRDFVLPHGCWYHFGMHLVLLECTWYIWNASTILESTLKLISLRPQLCLGHKPVGITSGRPQAKQLTGQGCSTTHQQTGCLKTWAHSHPWTWPCPLEDQESGPRHQCAGAVIGTHRTLWPETRGPKSIHQWAGTRLRITWAPDLHPSKPTVAMTSFILQQASTSTGTGGPRFIHQQANTSFRIPQTLQPGESGTGPTHQWPDTSPGSLEPSHACQSSRTRPRNRDCPLVDLSPEQKKKKKTKKNLIIKNKQMGPN